MMLVWLLWVVVVVEVARRTARRLEEERKKEFAGIDKKKTTRCFCFSGPLGVADSAESGA